MVCRLVILSGGSQLFPGFTSAEIGFGPEVIPVVCRSADDRWDCRTMADQFVPFSEKPV